MDLQKLTDEQLEQSFHRAVKSERKIMHIVILHVQEVSKRKFYLERNITTLRKYLIDVMLYSSGAASRRIEAAALLTAVPTIAESLENGKLSLSQIGAIHAAIQQAEKIHDEKVTESYKGKIVQQVLGKTTEQTQQACAQMLEIPVIEGQKARTQRDGSKRVEFTISEEQDKKIERVRGILAQKNFRKKRTQMLPDILETMCDEIIEQYEKSLAPKKPKKKAAPRCKAESKAKSECTANTDTAADSYKNLNSKTSDKVTASVGGTQPKFSSETEVSREKVAASQPKKAPSASEAEIPSATDVKTKKSSVTEQPRPWKTLTPRRKKIVLHEDKCCQHFDPITGTTCGSEFQLEVDHIILKSAGGSNARENLRALCRAHNQYRNRRKNRSQMPFGF